MKRKLLQVICFMFCPFIGMSQQLRHSCEGNGIVFNEKIRTLNIMINVIYDVNPHLDPVGDGNPMWGKASNEGVNNEAIPDNLLDFMDTVYISGNNRGFITRVLGESSFDSLQFIGDFVVVNVKESRVLQNFGGFNYKTILRVALGMINEEGLCTLYGRNAISDYDCRNTEQVYFSCVVFRNITGGYGGMGLGNGMSTTFGSLYKIKIGGQLYILREGVITGGMGNNIVLHEIAHKLFGQNNFHTSGGNHRGSGSFHMPFFTMQGGYGLMGAANKSLVGCNGYERWRMHWKHPGAPYYIAARHNNSNQYVPSDISKENGSVSFVLRDFVTTGDAVRIKLPYKSSHDASNQYIWLENHKVGLNNKLDYYLYSSTEMCRPQGNPGIYAYYQVGRDILSGEYGQVWSRHERDNLKIIPAEGYWDFRLNEETHHFGCVGWTEHPYYLSRETANPFCGYQDQETQMHPPLSDNELACEHEYYLWRKKIGDHITDSLAFLGDHRDAFTGRRKINMGTNPSTCNVKTYYNYIEADGEKNFTEEAYRNNQITYLTGLSIEMIPLADHDFRVTIRWNDYDIANDARWSGTIVNKEKVNLLSGNTIYLVQNKTPAIPYRDTITGFFAKATLLKCEEHSTFIQQPYSTVLVDEGSTLHLESGSEYTVSRLAELRIKENSFLTVDECAVLRIEGKLVVEPNASLRIHPNAVVMIEDRNNIVYNGNIDDLFPFVFSDNVITGNTTLDRPMLFTKDVVITYKASLTISSLVRVAPGVAVIVEPGARLIVDGGMLTHSCEGKPWQGIKVLGDATLGQLPSDMQGRVELRNGATISNAVCGIQVWDGVDPKTGGGIIKAHNTNFVNNITAVNFGKYQYVTGDNKVSNRSSFTKCHFIIDDDYFKENDCFFAHVKLNSVNGIKFTGCFFTDQRREKTQPCGMRPVAAYSHIPSFVFSLVRYPFFFNLATYNIGIWSSNSGFSVEASCNIQSYPGCPENEIAARPLFEGLRYGVYASNAAANNSILIDRAVFNKNNTGVYLSSVTNVSLLRSEFDIGYDNKETSIGIHAVNTSGFKIEENLFFGAMPGEKIGIKIENSGENNNLTYKNKFENLTVAQQFRGKNRHSTHSFIGLQALCNEHVEIEEYDILVEKKDDEISDGIRLFQGGQGELSGFQLQSAGNLFSASAMWNYENKSNNPVWYFYSNADPREQPVRFSPPFVEPKLVSDRNPCPSKLNATSIDILTVQYEQHQFAYRDLLYNYNQLIDGGNTQELLDDIQGKWSDDIWKIRYELLAKSPFLSEEVLKEVAYKNVLPHALFLEICLANVDATRSKDFIYFLQHKIPYPIPEYMISLIVANWNTKSVRTELEFGLAYHSSEKDYLLDRMLGSVMQDSIVNSNTVKSLFSDRSYYDDYFTIAEGYIEENNFESAYDIMYYLISRDEVKYVEKKKKEIESFCNYISILKDFSRNKKSIYHLEEKDVDRLMNYVQYGEGRGVISALNILCPIYHICMEEESKEMTKSLVIDPYLSYNTHGKTIPDAMTVFPNPAKLYTSFNWENLPGKSVLRIYDQTGRKIAEVSIDGPQGQWVWNTSNIPGGTYTYSVLYDNISISSGKIIVSQ